MEWNTGFEPAHRLWKSRMLPLHQSHIKVKNFFLTNTLNTPEFHCFLFVSSYNTPSNIPVLIAVLYPNVSSDMGTRQPNFINTCFTHNDMTETVSVIIMPKRKHSYRILFSAFRYYYASSIFLNLLYAEDKHRKNTQDRFASWNGWQN